MRRRVVWRGLEEWLAEECSVVLEEDRLRADGVQLGAAPAPYRLDYELVTGPGWVTERLLARVRDADGSRSLDLLRAADGAWTADGEALPELDGALDCDIEWSPLTNFMPARRLGAEPADHLMAFVEVPSLAVRPSLQRYEPIDGRRVRFVSLDGDFVSELELDDDGMIARYPRLAELVASEGRA